MSMMLNPKRQQRSKIAQVADHQWIAGVIFESYTPIEDDWRDKVIEKYAQRLDMSFETISRDLETKPYGDLGGIFNIEKHMHQLSKIALRRAPSCCRIKTIKVINRIKLRSIHHKLARLFPASSATCRTLRQ
jgi:hypothetical protein